MRRIVCNCDICGNEKIFFNGDIETGFLWLNTGVFGKLFICEDCDVKLCTRSKEDFKKSMKHFESFCEDFNKMKRR